MGSLADFQCETVTYDGVSKRLFTKGDGPGVVIMHEIPGITPAVATFARRVADAGFFVAMPELFGETGAPFSHLGSGREIFRSCVSEEFAVFAANHSSPVTHWLRALCRDVHKRRGGPGVGALGMCLTGNFALALAVDPCLMAPVLSQPSLPFPLTPAMRRGLHISAEDLQLVKRRCAADPGLKVIGLRFSKDPMCPAVRFRRLRDELGDAFEDITIDSARGNPDGPGIAHSVLTNHLIDKEGEPTRAALDRVLGYFKQRLCEA